MSDYDTATQHTLTIDPEFRRLIPPLRDDEYAALEASLLNEGCRDALVIWIEENILLDGHNRYALCLQHHIPYQERGISLPDRESAALWVLDNQLARRNLTDKQRKVLTAQRYNAEKQLHGGTGANQYSKQSDNNCHSAKTRARIAEEMGVSEGTIQNSIAFAEQLNTIEEISPELAGALLSEDIEASYKEIKKFATVCSEYPETAQAVVDELLSGTETSLLVAVRNKSPHVAYNTGDNEWYTPPGLIEAARYVMGSIDCDPATSILANRVIQAQTIYTRDEDGLAKLWPGNVWLNPPYSQPAISEFSKALCRKYQDGEIHQACILVNNATETAWFQQLLDFSIAVCFPSQRIRFLDPQGRPGAPLQGQALLLFSPYDATLNRFIDRFQLTGKVLTHAARAD